MVEDPERIIALVDRWLKEGRCKRLVVNLKFGRTDPVALLRRAELLRRHCPGLKARHLFHDREEFTLVKRRTPRAVLGRSLGLGRTWAQSERAERFRISGT